MSQLKKIPATVITGFLGAGKTTLIRHMLENAGGKRIALIINEFGDLGIDRQIVNGCGIEGCDEDDVVELANGCICCTVADDFLPVMEALVERDTPPDHIVIETSGLALPKPLIRAFNWPEIKTRVTVDGVVAVVDGPALAAGQFASNIAAVQAQRQADESLDHDNPLEEVFTDQLLAADMVLLNKADVIGEDEAARLIAELSEKLRPGVHVVATSHGDIGVDVLLGLDAGAFWSEAQAKVDLFDDLGNGMIKSLVFGFVVSWIAVFEGYDCIPTSEGLGQATTRTVVYGSLAILVLDFVLTALMFGK